jgi:biotin carboxyl carrier protein
MKLKAFLGDDEHDVEVREVEGGYVVVVDGTPHEIDTVACEASFYSLLRDGVSFEVSVREQERDTLLVRHGGYGRSVRIVDPLAAAAGDRLADVGGAEIQAVMPGRVVKVLVEEGATVEEGQGLLVLEAMKMENEVPAPRAGTVAGLHVTAGQAVESGETLIVIE